MKVFGILGDRWSPLVLPSAILICPWRSGGSPCKGKSLWVNPNVNRLATLGLL